MCDFGISELIAGLLAGTTAGATAGTTAGATVGSTSALTSAIAAETAGTTAGALGAVPTVAGAAADLITASTPEIGTIGGTALGETAGATVGATTGTTAGITAGDVAKDLGIGLATTGLATGVGALANKTPSEKIKNASVSSGNPNVADQKTALGVSPNKNKNRRTIVSLKIPTTKEKQTGLNTPVSGTGLNIPT